MKKQFSNKWQGSKQPRKQRKYLWNVPLHLKRKLMVSTLDKELRKKYSMRNIEIRKGDEVMVLIGKFKKKKGKIAVVNVNKKKVAVEGIQHTKRDGSKRNVWFDASNLKITSLNTDDKMRIRKRENAERSGEKQREDSPKETEKVSLGKTEKINLEEKKNAPKKK